MVRKIHVIDNSINIQYDIIRVESQCRKSARVYLGFFVLGRIPTSRNQVFTCRIHRATPVASAARSVPASAAPEVRRRMPRAGGLEVA